MEEEEKQLETAVDTGTNSNTTTSRLNSNRAAAAADEYDSDTIIDPANEHRDDPANTTTTRADSGSKGRRAPKKKYSDGASKVKKATGTNADLNYRDPGTDPRGDDDEDRHREAIMLSLQ
jgi:hypothetical protein